MGRLSTRLRLYMLNDGDGAGLVPADVLPMLRILRVLTPPPPPPPPPPPLLPSRLLPTLDEELLAKALRCKGLELRGDIMFPGPMTGLSGGMDASTILEMPEWYQSLKK